VCMRILRRGVIHFACLPGIIAFCFCGCDLLIMITKVRSVRQISGGTQPSKQARAMLLLSLMGHEVKIYFPDTHHL